MSDEQTVTPTENNEQPTASNDTLLSGNSDANNENADVKANETANESKSNETQTQEAESFKIELPDGYTDADRASIEKLNDVLKLNKEQADALTAYAKDQQEQQVQAMENTKQEWVSSLKQDKDFGGENFDKNIGYARLALQKTDEKGELMQLLNNTGFGSHPIVVKHFANIGKMFNDDTLVLSNAKSNANKPLEERLYKNS